MEIKEIVHSYFKNRLGVIATMHKKEEVIRPILEEFLGIETILAKDLNTDEYGTFTKDIERKGNQLEAARYKAIKAMELTGSSLAISSEGIFGPHPAVPFCLIIER